uniref:Uncharacterized protein n=1 Tax=Homalodisca liturata TaxID=320908 RepID=A0A1B6JHW6_9HEMI
MSVFKETRSQIMPFNIRSSKGRSLLHNAAIYSSIEELELLLNSGFDVNSKDVKGCTPLHFAVFVNFELGVDFLLNRGANVNSKCFGEAPLHIAAWKQRRSIFEKLIERGADVNCQNKNGLSVLHIATILGSLPFVDILFKKGVDVNIKDLKGNTPLHFAAKYGSIEIIKGLLTNKADIDSKNDRGQIALHRAAKFCPYRSAIKMLMIGGAEVNARDKEGRTPMHFAIDRPNGEIIKELLEWGGSLFIKDENGDQPLEWVSCTWVASHAFERNSMQLKCVGFNFDPITNFYGTKDNFCLLCKKEAKKMKLHRYGKDLLSDVFDKYGDPTYLANTTLKQAFEYDIELEYPVYGSLLRAIYGRAIKRAALLDIAQYSLTEFFPVEIVRHILSFLSDDDLQNVVNLVNCGLGIYHDKS